MDIFTTNSSRRGWCNVDPEEGYSNKVLFKEECDCKYDGLWGRFCEFPSESTCINQCAGHGRCRGGFCQVKHYCSCVMKTRVLPTGKKKNSRTRMLILLCLL